MKFKIFNVIVLFFVFFIFSDSKLVEAQKKVADEYPTNICHCSLFKFRTAFSIDCFSRVGDYSFKAKSDSKNTRADSKMVFPKEVLRITKAKTSCKTSPPTTGFQTIRLRSLDKAKQIPTKTTSPNKPVSFNIILNFKSTQSPEASSPNTPQP